MINCIGASPKYAPSEHYSSANEVQQFLSPSGSHQKYANEQNFLVVPYIIASVRLASWENVTFRH